MIDKGQVSKTQVNKPQPLTIEIDTPPEEKELHQFEKWLQIRLNKTKK